MAWLTLTKLYWLLSKLVSQTARAWGNGHVSQCSSRHVALCACTIVCHTQSCKRVQYYFHFIYKSNHFRQLKNCIFHLSVKVDLGNRVWQHDINSRYTHYFVLVETGCWFMTLHKLKRLKNWWSEPKQALRNSDVLGCEYVQTNRWQLSSVLGVLELRKNWWMKHESNCVAKVSSKAPQRLFRIEVLGSEGRRTARMFTNMNSASQINDLPLELKSMRLRCKRRPAGIWFFHCDLWH